MRFISTGLISLVWAAAACGEAIPDLPKGSVLWLDMDGLKSGAVAQWTDKSGRGNHLIQPAAAQQPQAIEDTGRTFVRFGGDDSLERAPLAGFEPGDQAFHVFMVIRAKMDSTSTNPRLMDLRSSEEHHRGFWIGYQGNGRNRLGITHGDEGEASTVAWDGRFHLVEMIYAGRQRWELFLDGELDGGGTYASRPFKGFDGPVKLTLGQHYRYAGANTFYRGDMAEVLVFKRMLSGAEQRKVGRWMTEKHGLHSRYHADVIGPTGSITGADRDHWAWQLPRRPDVPRVKGKVASPVDAFVLARLNAVGFEFALIATRTALVRRAYLDLTGLPPSPMELDAFLSDHRPEAYESLVDRLLASPRFGERWGRHWLDAAGYTDIIGGDNDAGTIKQGKGKWRYRDWVIRAFNDDKPYDVFITEQLAGDELADWRAAKSFSAEMIDRLVATGFLRVAADNSDEPELNTPDKHHEVLQLTTEIVAGNLLGLTWQCAKCHDHKLDPIPQADYYRLQAFFSPAFNPRQWLIPKNRELPDLPSARRAEIDRKNGELKKQADALRNQRKALAGKKNEADGDAMKELDARISVLDMQQQSYGFIQAVYDVGRPPATRLLVRGDLDQPGGEVLPALPEAFAGGEVPAESIGHSSGRRLALARALTHPDSRAAALVARVQVNRIWAHLFGEGIVKTTGNLGPSGIGPTHPDLLDWLASQYVEDGWRFKPLIKRLVMSRVYRQTSQAPADASREHLLPRMRLKRLESEAIRDAVLAASGQLDLKMGGPPEGHEVKPSGLVTIKGNPNRRSVYVLARRNYHPTLLAVFDQPFQTTLCTMRERSAVVSQSLAMLNSSFVLEHSEHFARRVAPAGTAQLQVREAFKIALARVPDDNEMKECLDLLTRQDAHYRKKGRPEAEARHLALRDFCQVVLNLSEFIYVP